jgi:hypothetical protein
VRRRSKAVVGAAIDIASIGTAAIPIFGGSVTAMFQAIENHHVQAELRMLNDIIDALTERIFVIEGTTGTPEQFVDLVAHAVRVSPELRSDELRLGVANIVAVAFCVIPPQVERAHLLIDIAARLSPDHLAVLRAVSRVLADSYEVSDRNRAKPWSKASLIESLPYLQNVIDPLIAQLESFGAMREVPPPGAGREISVPFGTGWALSAFGVQLLDHLDGDVGQQGL